jgi:hypothetical protein
MSKLTNIERPVVKTIRKDIQDALDKVGEKFGLAFSVGTISYTNDSIGARIEGALTSTPGEPKMAVDFRKNCWKHGLKESDLGRVFSNHKLERFKIVGLKPRNRKYPIIAEKVSNGRTYKFSPMSVKMGLGRDE